MVTTFTIPGSAIGVNMDDYAAFLNPILRKRLYSAPVVADTVQIEIWDVSFTTNGLPRYVYLFLFTFELILSSFLVLNLYTHNSYL